MIRLIDAEKIYDNGTHALNGVSFTVDDGEFAFLVGPSGSGKSTIIKLLTGEVVPTSGRVMVNGFSMSRISERQIPYMRRTIGVIFQDFRLIANKTVYDNLALAMRAVGASPKALRERIPYVLELVGLADKENRYPDELSGGEQQRVAIARALVNNPSTIVADEPTGNLDIANEQLLMRLAKKAAQERHIAVLSSLHDLNQALSLGDRFFFLKDGVITCTVPRDGVTSGILRDALGGDLRLVEVEGERIVLHGRAT
jgi:cell division transport system ATP-binding protein